MKTPLMKLGILKADSVMPEMLAQLGDYPDMLEALLGRAAKQLDIALSFTTYDVEQGQYPARVDECAGYVITGSRKSVYDDEPWVQELGAYLQVLDAARAKLVGICFGHQLIAQCMGGRVAAAEVGWGVGIHQSKIVRRTWFMEAGDEDYSLIVSHRDQVLALPEGAELIASSDFCPMSMFCLGEHILAMQGHPEFNRDYASYLMDYREAILGQETYQAGKASLAGALSHARVARWILRFLQARHQYQD